jgi:hypothetical protein
MYGEWRYSSTILNLNNIWKFVVNFRHQPLYPRGKNPRRLLYRRLGGPQSPSTHYGEKKNPLPLPRIEPRFLVRPACSLVAIPTECPWPNLRYYTDILLVRERNAWRQRSEQPVSGPQLKLLANALTDDQLYEYRGSRDGRDLAAARRRS